MTTTSTTQRTETHNAQVEAFQDKMIQAALGVFDTFSIHIGHKLGLYTVLSQNNWVTSNQLSLLTKTQERYIREWLEQQTLSGILEVQDETAGPFDRQYRISPAHAEVLANSDSLDYLAPLAQLVVGVTTPMPQLLDAMRHGGGVAYQDYGTDMRQGQGAINRVTFLECLGKEWIPAMPQTHQRLQDQTAPARVADFGCGLGWSSIGIAKAYPDIHVDGFDSDPASIEEARQHAAEHNVADRVTFHCVDVAEHPVKEKYDLVLMCEVLHDMGDPISALKNARELLNKNGTLLVVDERVNETFTANGDDIERMMYGWSILHCLPCGMADGAEQCCGGTGTVMRPATVNRYASESGFKNVNVLPVENVFFRLYQLNA